MKGILGRKIGMTQVFTKSGKLIPVVLIHLQGDDGAAVIQRTVLGELADADGVAFRSGHGGGGGEGEGGGDSDHALQHRNTSCFLGVLPG